MMWVCFFSFWKTHDLKPNESQTKIKMSQCGMCIFTQLQKCSCPVQIVKSRDNSPEDELDLCFTGCPEGLQFQNSRKLSRKNSDCSTNSKLHTDHSRWVKKRSAVKYAVRVKVLKLQCFPQSKAKYSADTS